MTCPRCGRNDCDDGLGDAAEGEAPQKDLRRLFTLDKRIRAEGGVETVVFTTPPAAALDVFAIVPGGSLNGTVTVKVYAQTRTVKGLVATSLSPNWGTSKSILQIRDTPCDQFEITVSDTATTGFPDAIDFVVIGWAQEPTGIGPQSLSSMKVGDATTVRGEIVGGVPMLFGADGTTNTFRGGAWTQLTQAQTTGFANVIPYAQYIAAIPTLTAGNTFGLQLDQSGFLRVALQDSGGTNFFPGAAALGDTDTNPTTTRVGADVQWWTGTSWTRARSGSFGATGLTAGNVAAFANTIPIGRFTNAAPTLTDGQGWFFQLDVNGNLKVVEQKQPVYEDNTNGVAASHDKPLSGTTYNATAKDIIAKANTGNIKAAAGNLYRLYVTNDNAAAQAYALVNKATNPATGDTPVMYFYVAAKTTALIEFRYGKQFAAGISWAQVTTLGAATITLAATSDTLINAEYA